uniref:Putative ovule protein n=1 Tax=Solanum chacoense TaxID=4108 RepID=A0A0V0GT58_SOLCH
MPSIALHRRLSTKDRMVKWGITNVLTCPMCQLEDEDIDHMFFGCSFNVGIWNRLLAWQGIHITGLDWQGEIQWAIKHMTSKNSTAQVYKMTLAGMIYHL